MGTSREDYVAVQADLFRRPGLLVTSVSLTLGEPWGAAHVLVAGEGAPVLLIHGGNSAAALMEPLLSSLALRRRVFAPDRPGCGLSEPFDYAGVDLRAHAVDLIDAWLDGLGLESVDVVANSMGGYFSLCYVLARPDRVRRLVLVGEPAGSGEQWVVRPPDRPSGWEPSIEDTRSYHAFLLVADDANLSDAYLRCANVASRLPGARSSWASLLGAADASGLTRRLAAELSGVRTPTTFVWGERDAFGPPELAVTFAASMPDARVVTIPAAGHLVWIDAPERTARAVLAALA
jgi:pimeloyl-ACP methyl ester carboxylesterase